MYLVSGNNFLAVFFQMCYEILRTFTESRGGARGGLEGTIAPSSELASPPLQGEQQFFQIFLTFIVP